MFVSGVMFVIALPVTSVGSSPDFRSRPVDIFPRSQVTINSLSRKYSIFSFFYISFSPYTEYQYLQSLGAEYTVIPDNPVTS
jgi:hypothetical protein